MCLVLLVTHLHVLGAMQVGTLVGLVLPYSISDERWQSKAVQLPYEVHVSYLVSLGVEDVEILVAVSYHQP